MHRILARSSIFAVLAALPASAATITARLSDQNDSPVDNAVVYAFPLQESGELLKQNCAGKCAPAAVTQKNLAFDPEVTVVETGSKVRFLNLDRTKHQVYSVSNTKKFELPLYGGSSQAPENAPAVEFDRSGEVVLGCNIHDSMKAYIFVVDTPYFVKATGSNYVLKDLPAGKYMLRVWHPLAMSKDDLPSQKIEVNAASSEDWPVKLSLRKPAKSATPNLSDYR